MPPATKKRKIAPSSSVSRDIKRLEDDLTAAISKKLSLNPLADLVELAWNSSEPQETSKSIYALYRVFISLLASGNNKLFGGGSSSETKVVKTWLWARLNRYTELLVGLLKDEEKTLGVLNRVC